MKKFLKFAVPILYLAIGVGGFVWFELDGKDRINTVDVVVAREDIKFKDKITEENLQIVSIRKDNFVTGAIVPKDLDTILNQNASIDIKKGTQIYPALVDKYDLIPNEEKGEFIAPIPDEWLFAVPGSLRKTFIADFYAIPDKDQAIIRSLVQEAKEHSENEASSEEGSSEEQTSSEEQPIETNETIDTIIQDNNQPIVKDVRVASVKDNTNSEVTESKEDEKSATGTVANLEIISNNEILSTLREYTQQGYKIYVVYKYER